MKNVLGVVFTLSLLTACSSPVLKWIDTPNEGAGGRIIGQDWEKEITAFDFPDITGENVIIGGEPQPDGKYPIVAVVPRSSAGSLSAETPAITFRGSSISPGPSTPENFTNPLSPVSYTVTAGDLSIREYVVKVVIREDDDYGKQITGFFFTEPMVEGVIDETKHTIALTVPRGTNLSVQRPEVFYTGVSVNPASGRPVDFSAASVSPLSADKTGKTPVKYTVRDQGGLSQSYDVWVFPIDTPVQPVISLPDGSGGKVDVGTVADANGDYKTTYIVEFPTYIENPVININYPGAGNTVNIDKIDIDASTLKNQKIFLENNNVSIENTEVVNYIPILMDNGEYTYVMVVNPPAPPSTSPSVTADASIDAFYFTNPVAIGKIEGTGASDDPYRITVTVPSGTNLRNLTPGICYTGKEIVGNPGANPLTGIARSFTSPVGYTVKSTDGAVDKTYTVTVTEAPNTAKEITAFTFSEISAADTSTIIGAMPNAEGKYPIEITIPAGREPKDLTPVITHTGVSIEGQGFSPGGGPGTPTAAAGDFNSPVDYTVKAQDTTTRIYTVTVRNAVPQDEDIEITGFYFANPLAVGAINQDINTITVAVPSKTNTANLAPMVYFRGMSVRPNSGAANDFSGPVVYTVTGRNGKTRSYTVTVNNTPSGSKDIVRFDYPGIENTETIIGAVPGNDGNYPISVWVPAGTDIAGYSPDIVYTGIDLDVEGTNYTVIAEDGTTKTYTLKVEYRDNTTKLITSLILNEIPLAGGRTLRVVAGIDQDSRTITATVPYAADISSLKPVITYIGRSIAGPGGGDKTTNPFTDAARNFGSPQTYTVKDQSGGAQTYTVRVQRQSSISVHFEGETDRAIIASNSFDQNTGVITVTVDTGQAAGPYGWYVDGVMQALSSAETTFTLNVGTGNFTPGRHEILLSGTKDGLHYTGRVYFTAAGGIK